MHKYVSILLLIAFSTFSQSDIPVPTGASQGAGIIDLKVIGDYDGDESKDLFIQWSTAAGNYFTIYSHTKNQYQLEIFNPGSSYWVAGDMNNDGNDEVVIGKKIYSYGAVVSKKKL